MWRQQNRISWSIRPLRIDVDMQTPKLVIARLSLFSILSLSLFSRQSDNDVTRVGHVIRLQLALSWLKMETDV